VKTTTKKRIPGWGLRPGLAIGCKITLRGKKAEEIFEKLIKGKDNILSNKQFDENGNIAFGIHEYIDVPDLEYDPKIGIMGFEVCVTLKRPGYRVKKRFKAKRKIGKNHIIKKEEAMEFIKNKFSVKIGED
ncbi:MAG: 50S ribosomal protein L5, partial [Minisyncoccales bacterium]